MPQITGPIVINNGAATPVAKSFAPERVAPEGSVFVERSAASALGFLKLGLKYSAGNSARRTNRVDIDLTMPTTQNLGGLISIADTGLFRGYWVIPDAFTADQRADLHAFVANAIAHAIVKAAVKDLDPAY